MVCSEYTLYRLFFLNLCTERAGINTFSPLFKIYLHYVLFTLCFINKTLVLSPPQVRRMWPMVSHLMTARTFLSPLCPPKALVTGVSLRAQTLLSFCLPSQDHLQRTPLHRSTHLVETTGAITMNTGAASTSWTSTHRDKG